MALRICEDNFIFFLINMKYFEVLCCFVILFFIALFILIQNDRFVKKINFNNFQKSVVVIISILLVGFLFFLFAWLLNTSSFNGCSCKYNENIMYNLEETIKTTFDSLENNRVMIIGDSRMEYIAIDDKIVKPFNVDFISKGGASLEWFEDEAMKDAYNLLDNDDYLTYNIVVNMGVNDIQYTDDYLESADKYFNNYLKLAEYSSKIKLYIMSVNPIIEKKLNKSQPQNVRTNKKIEKFNKVLVKDISKADKDNIYYCDANRNLRFGTDDGLHYTRNTNKEILNYIINDCVKF